MKKNMIRYTSVSNINVDKILLVNILKRMGKKDSRGRKTVVKKIYVKMICKFSTTTAQWSLLY